MSISSMSPLSAGLAGIHSATDLLARSATQTLDASLGKAADLEGAVVNQVRAEVALSASTAVIKAGDAQLESLIELFTS